MFNLFLVARRAIFAFLPHNFGNVAMNGILSAWVQFWVVSTLIGGGDTQTQIAVIEFAFCTHRW